MKDSGFVTNVFDNTDDHFYYLSGHVQRHALAEHVLKRIKLDHPDVKIIYTKSVMPAATTIQ